MNSRLLILLAGILAIVSAWLPWTSGTVMGMDLSTNGFRGEYKGNPGIIFVAMGVIIAVMGLINKKWSAIIAILISLCVGGLGFKYYNDGHMTDPITINIVGYGIYVMMAAGLLGVIGGIMGLKSKGGAAATAA